MWMFIWMLVMLRSPVEQQILPRKLTWNWKITPLKRKIIWTKPPFWGSMLVFGVVYPKMGNARYRYRDKKEEAHGFNMREIPCEKNKRPAWVLEFNTKQGKPDCCLNSNTFGDLDIIQAAWKSWNITKREKWYSTFSDRFSTTSSKNGDNQQKNEFLEYGCYLYDKLWVKR